ncbi:MAG: SDR family NAD(P)-dependent oxidoreductase [Flavobacteriaceae bacterium]
MAKVVITGCSRGIGYELAKLFAEDGHSVLALSRNPEPILSLSNELISAFPFDLEKKEDLNHLNSFLDANWKQVDILINNAGSLLNKPFLETTDEEFKSVYNVNLFGVVSVLRTVIPFMLKSGHVVNISSMGGIQGSLKFPGLSAYSSSKGALITLTELLAEEFKDSGPSFNALALGAVQTEMLEEAFPGFKAPVNALEMARYIVRFAMESHRYFNGKVLQVSSSTP